MRLPSFEITVSIGLLFSSGDSRSSYVARDVAIVGMAATTATIQIATTRHGCRSLTRAQPLGHRAYRTRLKMLCIQGAQSPLWSRSHQATEIVPSGFTAIAPSLPSSYWKRAGPSKVSVPPATSPA